MTFLGKKEGMFSFGFRIKKVGEEDRRRRRRQKERK
jgi:hypothetical protein